MRGGAGWDGGGAWWDRVGAGGTVKEAGRPGAPGALGCILGAMAKSAAARRSLPTSPFKAPATPRVKTFDVGDRVTHDEHGLGRVIEIEDGVAALVDFGSARHRILSPYAKMTKL